MCDMHDMRYTILTSNKKYEGVSCDRLDLLLTFEVAINLKDSSIRTVRNIYIYIYIIWRWEGMYFSILDVGGCQKA